MRRKKESRTTETKTKTHTHTNTGLPPYPSVRVHRQCAQAAKIDCFYVISHLPQANVYFTHFYTTWFSQATVTIATNLLIISLQYVQMELKICTDFFSLSLSLFGLCSEFSNQKHTTIMHYYKNKHFLSIFKYLGVFTHFIASCSSWQCVDIRS